MSTTFEHDTERSLLEVESSGAAIEAIGGLAVIVLSIIGLSGLAPIFVAAVAGILLGVSLFAQGTAVASEFQHLFSRLSGGTLGAIEVGTGMAIEIAAGAAAVSLGIIALINIAPDILLPALVIAGGASLVLSAGTVQRLNSLKMTAAETPTLAQQLMHVATSGLAAGQLLAGGAASVLGIIALSLPAATLAGAAAGSSWLTLTLIALLVLGSSIAMSGGSLVGRFVQMLRREGASS